MQCRMTHLPAEHVVHSLRCQSIIFVGQILEVIDLASVQWVLWLLQLFLLVQYSCAGWRYVTVLSKVEESDRSRYEFK